MADEDGLQRFLTCAADHRLLTAREEQELGKRVQRGTRKAKGSDWKGTPDAREARNKLVESNVRLVMSIARYYRNRGLAMEDVVQAGIIGLNRAAEKFDPEKNIRFSTYATLWIKQAIQRGLTSGGTAIRLPSTVAGARIKLQEAEDNIERPAAGPVRYISPDGTVREEPAKEPVTLECLTDRLEAESATLIERALNAAEVVTSLDREVVSEEHTHRMGDAIPDIYAPDPHDLVADDLIPELRAALSSLEPNHRRVIEMSFGLKGKKPMTVVQIAAKLGVAQNTVRTLRSEAMEFVGHRLDHHR